MSFPLSHEDSGQYNIENTFEEPTQPTRRPRNHVHTCQQHRVQQFRGPGYLDFIGDDNGHLLPSVKATFKKPPRPDWGPQVSVWDELEEDCEKRRERYEKYRQQAESLKLTRFKLRQAEGEKKGACGAPPKSSLTSRSTVSKPPVPSRTAAPKPSVPPNTPKPFTPLLPSVQSTSAITDLSKPQVTEKTSDEILASAFDNIKRMDLPVVLICGYPNEKTFPTRSDFVKQMVKRLGFTLIDLDTELQKFLVLNEKRRMNPDIDLMKEFQSAHTVKERPSRIPKSKHSFKSRKETPEEEAEILFTANKTRYERQSKNSQTNISFQNRKFKQSVLSKELEHLDDPSKEPPLHMSPRVYDLCLKRMLRFAKKANDESELTFNVDGVLQLIKMMMLLSYPTKGFIINHFPVTIEEALGFRDQLWKFKVAMYFAYFDERDPFEVRINEGYIKPTLARRPEPYDDIKLENEMAIFGDDFVKIYFDQDWRPEQLNYVHCLVGTYLGRGSCAEIISKLEVQAIPSENLKREKEKREAAKKKKAARQAAKKKVYDMSTTSVEELALASETSSVLNVAKGPKSKHETKVKK